MTVSRRLLAAPADQVWDVLADGWLYPLWVVGASCMRNVDDTWPDVGSKLHHSVGAWPLLLHDETEVLGVVPGHSLRLRARGWPLGEAEVDIALRPTESRTEVVMAEEPVAGPGTLVPFRGLTLGWRNAESLRRLSYLAENRPRGAS
jgi:uncharacterized protein YndB with AHSA1/START domain